MKIAILAGGYSRERDVSLSSGFSVAASLCRLGHEVRVIDPYLGICLPEGNDGYVTAFHAVHPVPDNPPDLPMLYEKSHQQPSPVSPTLPGLLTGVDAVFLALHGGCGENGQMQAYLDLLGVPYTGAGYGASYLCMDKWRTKLILRAAGVPVPAGQCLRRGDLPDEKLFSYPCVCKPRFGGSSAGLSFAETRQALADALHRAGEEEMIVEEKVAGREFSVGVLDGKILPAVELIPETAYDFRAKYQPGAVREVCPAALAPCEWQRLRTLTMRAATALETTVLARLDFRMDSAGDFRCLEANTLPGMTPTSLLPLEAKSAGIDRDELCGRILASGVRLRSEERVGFFCGN